VQRLLREKSSKDKPKKPTGGVRKIATTITVDILIGATVQTET